MSAIKEVADRLDGKAVQEIERADERVEMLTDAELLRIAAGGLHAPSEEPRLRQICLERTEGKRGYAVVPS